MHIEIYIFTIYIFIFGASHASFQFQRKPFVVYKIEFVKKQLQLNQTELMNQNGFDAFGQYFIFLSIYLFQFNVLHILVRKANVRSKNLVNLPYIRSSMEVDKKDRRYESIHRQNRIKNSSIRAFIVVQITR